MGKLGRFIFFITLIAILFILVTMLIQTVGSEDETSIFRLSIIINDSSDIYWKNFRKGVDSAAVQYNVDVNFVTLPEGSDSDVQISYIAREIENDADAIIISAVDGEGLAGYLNDVPSSIPIIAVSESIPSGRVNVTIVSDSRAMGAMLADKINESADKKACAIIVKEDNREYILQRLEGLEEGLTKYGLEYTIENVVSRQEEEYKDTILVALEENVLEQLLSYRTVDARIFGIGFTNKILYAMDAGLIEGIVIQSDYSEGYLSVKAAYNCLKDIKQPNRIVLRYYSATKQNMFTSPLDRILFPLS